MAKRAPPPPPRSRRRTRRDLGRALEAAELKAKHAIAEIEINHTSAQALFHAMLVFISTPGLTIREVYENYRAADHPEAPLIRELISFKGFQNAAARQRWVEKRERHWLKVEERVLNHLQTDHVQEEIKEIEDLKSMKGRLLLHVHGGETEDGTKIHPVKPKSLEGAVRAAIALDQRQSQKRELVVQATARASAEATARDVDEGVSHIAGELPGVVVEDEMSEEEIAELAEQISMRRAGLISEEDDDAEPKRRDASEEGEE